MARVDSFENVGAVGLAGDPAHSADRRVGFAAGVLGAGAGLLVAFVARFGLGVPTPPELVADRILSALPPALFEAVLQTLSVYAKPLLFATMLAFELFVGGLVGALVATRWPLARKPIGGLAIGLALAAIVLLAGLPALGYGLAGQSTRTGAGLTALTILLSGLAYGLVLSVALRYATPTLELEAEAEAAETDLSAHGRRRRLLLTRIAAGLFVLSGGAVIWKLVGDLGARAFSRPIKGLSPEITPVGEFYTVSKNFLDPTVDAASWKVEITGLVDQPLTLTYDDLKALPSVEKIHTLACISNPVGGDLIGNASWKGVRVKDLMAKAGVKAGAVDAVLRAADDYADSVPVAKLLESETLLVYEMNGAPLKPTHGFPARLLIPNIYGMKNVKWLTKIEIVDKDFIGYWQESGWSDTAEYQIFSRVDTPTPGEKRHPENATIAGVAFAGNRGITKVEVSLDGGKTWREAAVKERLSDHAWQLWAFEWKPEKDDSYLVTVRATDGTGAVQVQTMTDPAPNGATGYHTLVLTVDGSQPKPAA